MDEDIDIVSHTIFSRSLFPFFFGAFFIGFGMGVVMAIDDVIGLICLGIGTALAFYSVYYWWDYKVEVKAIKKDR